MANIPLDLPVPDLADPAHVPGDMQRLVDVLKRAGLIDSGSAAARPNAADHPGLYTATDTRTVWFSTGAEWITVGPAPGDLKAVAKSTADPGWVMCDNATYPRTGIYADLFAAMGGPSSPWGMPDGTTFRVPDLRGRVPVGVDGVAGRVSFNEGLGQSGGNEVHVLTVAEIPSHQHPMDLYGNPSTAGSTYTPSPSNSSNGGTMPTNYAGGGQAHNNMQPYTVVNWLVKL